MMFDMGYQIVLTVRSLIVWVSLLFITNRIAMKRSYDYFSDTDEEVDSVLVQATDQAEQSGGALPPTQPLFTFQFTRVGPRRRWRNIVTGDTFQARRLQNRPSQPDDNLGQAIAHALEHAIQTQLASQSLRPIDRVNFSLQANGFQHAFQSMNFTVQDFLDRTLRLDTFFTQLADKLNSNQSFEPGSGFEVSLSTIRMPTPGSKKKKYSVGRRCMEKDLQRKQSLIPINNDDELCCARAIVTMRAWCHRDEGHMGPNNWDTLRRGLPRQAQQARELHTLAGVPEVPCGYDELVRFQAALGIHYQIIALSYAHPFLCFFKGDPAPHVIRIIKSNSHYIGCTSFPAFVNKSYYCEVCDTAYNTEDPHHHPCGGRKCPSCNRLQCPDYRIGTTPTLRCPRCNCPFFGPQCLQFHQSGTTCDKFRTCPQCQAMYTVKRGKRHQCGRAQCPSCRDLVPIAEHRCFIQPTDPNTTRDGKPNPMLDALMVYADIEALQLPDRRFEANMLCYRTAEEETIHCLRGSDCVHRFLRDLDDLAFKARDVPAADDDEEDDAEAHPDERPLIIVFHNLKGFDGNFILQALYADQRTVTSQLTVGAKVLSFQSGPLTFKDSLCFLPMPLASFPKTFGITELKKGYFPHAFNTPDNQSYVGRIPDQEFYDPEGMKDADAKQAFERWHDEQVARITVFDFQSEMEAYCQSDVALLQAGCEAFCQQFTPIAGFNPFLHATTIAGACNLYWRYALLSPDTIAVQPMQGWRGHRSTRVKRPFNGWPFRKV